MGGISAAAAWKADSHAVDDIAEAYCKPSDARRLQRSLHLRVAPALVTALLAEQHYDWATHRHYLPEASMAKLRPARDNDTAPDTGIIAIT